MFTKSMLAKLIRPFSSYGSLIEQGKSTLSTPLYNNWLQQIEMSKFQDYDPPELINLFRLLPKKQLSPKILEKIDDYFHYYPFTMSSAQCYEMLHELDDIEGIGECPNLFYTASRHLRRDEKTITQQQINSVVDSFNKHVEFNYHELSFLMLRIKARHECDLRFLFTRKLKLN